MSSTPTMNEQMTEYFASLPEGEAPDLKHLAQQVAKATVKKGEKLGNKKGIPKYAMRGYESYEEAAKLGKFNAGDSCEKCGKVFQREYPKYLHFEKDTLECVKARTKKGAAARPKPEETDFVVEFCKNAIDFGIIDEPFSFTQSDIIKSIICETALPEDFADAIKLKPFKKKLFKFAKETMVKKTVGISVNGMTISTEEGEEATLASYAPEIFEEEEE